MYPPRAVIIPWSILSCSKKSSPGFVGSLVRERERSKSAFFKVELLPDLWRFLPSFSLADDSLAVASLGLFSLIVGRLRGDNERCNFIRSMPDEVGVPGGVVLPVCGEMLLGLKCGLNGVEEVVGEGGPQFDNPLLGGEVDIARANFPDEGDVIAATLLTGRDSRLI